MSALIDETETRQPLWFANYTLEGAAAFREFRLTGPNMLGEPLVAITIDVGRVGFAIATTDDINDQVKRTPGEVGRVMEIVGHRFAAS